jgi:hypothetical protein
MKILLTIIIFFSILFSPTYSFYYNLTGVNFFINDLSFEASDPDNSLANQQEEPNGIFPNVLPVLFLSRINLAEVLTSFFWQALFPQQKHFILRC